MIESAKAMLSNTGVPEDQWVFQRSADLRYARQAYELNVPLEGDCVDHGSLKKLAEGYHKRHSQTYGHKNEAESVQIVTLRLTATGQLPNLPIRQKRPTDATPLKPTGWRGSPKTNNIETPVLNRDRFAGARQ